jgi:transcriptional regulator with XRE-family HTH domain
MASRDIQDILATLDAYESDPESCGIDARLIFSRIVLRQLAANGWSQRELAKRTGFKEAYISRIVHSDANCTFDSFGRILFAFGIDAKQVLLERDNYGHEESVSQEGDTATEVRIIRFPQGGSGGPVHFAARAQS